MPLPASYLHIDASDRLPVSRQIERQTRQAIAARRLRPGDRLSPSPQLAELLAVSPRAARKAYRELVRAGLCEPDGGGGLRVSARSAAARAVGKGAVPPSRQRGPTHEELTLARQAQCRLLPPPRVEVEGLVVAARDLPARFVTGDFYDVHRLPDGSVGVVVADVAGKGIGTSLIMASVQAMTPFIAAGRSLEETMDELNRRLCLQLGRRQFVALACARLDPVRGALRVANAGLPEPYVLRPGQEPRALSLAGPRLPLGVRAGLSYRSLAVELCAGDRLLLYSDGLPEAITGGGEPLGYETFAALLREVHAEDHRLPVEHWLDRLLARLLRATGRAEAFPPGDPPPLRDDITALVVEYPARSSGSVTHPPARRAAEGRDGEGHRDETGRRGR